MRARVQLSQKDLFYKENIYKDEQQMMMICIINLNLRMPSPMPPYLTNEQQKINEKKNVARFICGTS